MLLCYSIFIRSEVVLVNKRVLLIVLLFLFFVLGVFVWFGYFVYPIEIKSISYEVINKEIVAHIEFKKNFKDGNCLLENSQISPIENNVCSLKVLNEKTDAIIRTRWNEITISLDPDVDRVLDFTLSDSVIYLVVGEKKKVEVDEDVLGNPLFVPVFQSSNEDIVSVSSNTIEGMGSGHAVVSVSFGDIVKDIDVFVTNLLTLPTYSKRKDYLKCGIYTEDDNRLLDAFLEYRIKNVGYKTRAGVVEALRFLTLMFPYQISYFYENGRLNNNTGGNYVDGEGRFYHKGLYLNSYKYSDIIKKGYGPAIWGCPLTNWQDEAGFIPGVKYPNGLDCSGFISWAMYNGGFDPGDTGAGDNLWRDDDLSDLGVHERITMELLESNTLKAGDIIATDGHIAMIGGINDGIVYVAESTTYWYGVVMHPYTYQELVRTDYLTYVIKMDHYYKEDGNYSLYWE